MEVKAPAVMTSEELTSYLETPKSEELSVMGTEDDTTEQNATETPATPETETKADASVENLKAEMAELKKQNEAMAKKNQHLDQFMARVGTELGLLRKTSPEEEIEELQKIKDLQIEGDPIAVADAIEAYKKRQKEREEIREYAQLFAKAEETRNAITQYNPDFEKGLDDMAAVMAEDGAPKEVIENWKQNPYYLSQLELHNLYKRAQLMKQVSGLQKENEDLKKQFEELKQKPAQLLKNIANAPRTMTARSGGVSGSDSGKVSPQFMTSAELEEYLNKT